MRDLDKEGSAAEALAFKLHIICLLMVFDGNASEELLILLRYRYLPSALSITSEKSDSTSRGTHTGSTQCNANVLLCRDRRELL